MVKPFAMEELIVRSQVLAKRRSGQVSRLSVSDLEIDLKQHQASRANTPPKTFTYGSENIRNSDAF